MNLVLGARLILVVATIGIGALGWKYNKFFWIGMLVMLLSWIALLYGIFRYYQPTVPTIQYMVG